MLWHHNYNFFHLQRTGEEADILKINITIHMFRYH